MPRASTAQKTRPEGDSAGALRRAGRNADRRTSGAINASRVCFAQLPHCPVRQHARSGHGTVLPRVVLIAGRPTLQTPRRSPGVSGNLEFSSTRASIRVPCDASHGLPGRLPRPTLQKQCVWSRERGLFMKEQRHRPLQNQTRVSRLGSLPTGMRIKTKLGGLRLPIRRHQGG